MLLGALLALVSLVALVGLPAADVRGQHLRAMTALAFAAHPTPPGFADTRPSPERPTGLLPVQGAPASLDHRDRSASADVDPETQAEIDALLEKVAKKEAKIATKEAKLVEVQAALAEAQLALLAALTMPETTPAELAAKQAAVKKATKKVGKKLKKIEKLLGKIAALESQKDDFEQTISELQAGDGDPGGGDPGGGDPASVVSVPLLVQEVLAAGEAGLKRLDACATFGIPFAEGEVPQADDRPALAVANSETWQFRTLSEWPDGSVQWALVDAVTDVQAGGIVSALEITGGAGASDGAPVASVSGNTITLDTGVLQATVLKSGFNLFDTVVIDGTDVVVPHQSAGILGQSEDGQLVSPRATSLVVDIEENGPARAVVRVDGTLATLSGTDLIDFTCRITARAASADLQVDFTLRNASILRPQHVVLEGLSLVVRAQPGTGAQATFARHLGESVVSVPAGSSAYLRQAYSSAPTTDVTGTGTNYLPPIPKLDSDTLAEEGYEFVVDGTTIWGLGDKTKYPAHGYVDLTGATGGVTLSQRQFPYFWPSCLEAWGNGDVVAGLWTERNIAPYTFCWRQHESRTVSFSFHKGPAPPPLQAARRLDAPVNGRAADYAQYDQAGVLPYRLLTLAQQNQAYALMGLAHAVDIVDDSLSVTRFLAAHNTGGSNNHDSIERRMGGEWLRHGHGGQWLNAMDLALYKSEWQILRSDDFEDIDDPGANNDEIPHSEAYEGDLEHRYRDGMVLAYWLTGDERLKDALFDEEEILSHVENLSQERSLYQTIRAQATVGRFTDSNTLRAELHEKLDYVLLPTLDIETVPSGFGWEAAPGEGDRHYFVNSTQNPGEKPPGENYVTRGFISASLGPLGYYHAYTWLGMDDEDAQAARLRLTDLAWYTRQELFPFFSNPADRHLVYAWAVTLQQVVTWESSDFHPILLGMAEAYKATGDGAFMAKGVEQIQAFAAHDQGPYSDNMYLLDSRLDCQHFMAVFLDFATGVPP